MKKINSRLFFAFTFIFGLLNMQETKAQYAIDGVSYQLKYNNDLCHYEVLLIVNQGSTTTFTQRIAFNANISLRYKAGEAPPKIKDLYYPVGNTNNLPLPDQWLQTSSALNPSADTSYSYIAFVPKLSGIGAPFVYKGTGINGEINQGDTIKLFSLAMDINDCSSNFRLYINGVDPPSSAPGMGGGNFENGFVIENPANQVYQNNATQVFPSKPLITDLTSTCTNGINIDLTASGALKSNGTHSTCQGPLSYAWSGPAGHASTTQDVNMPSASSINRGIYSVTVTDTMGCSNTASILAENKPNAGPDKIITAGEIVTLGVPDLGVADSTSGIWSSISNYGQFNPSSTNIGRAIVNFSSYNLTTTTTYTYTYTVGNGITTCSDTMRITVNPKPAVGFFGAPFICAYNDNNTKQLNPPSGGTWVSNNPAVATVSGNLITGVSPGLVTFTFTNSVTGASNTTPNLRVDPKPVATIGTNTLCLNGTTVLTPSTNGNWILSNSAIASIGTYVDPNGAGTFFGIRGDTIGTTKLVYRVNIPASQPSCLSDTLELNVISNSTTNLITPNLCVGNNGSIIPSPNVPGTWESSDPLKATINNSGVISALSPGNVQFIFTQNATGCKSFPSATLTVTSPPVISGIPNSVVFAGTVNAAVLTVNPISAGTWTSNNPSIATINPNGVITTLAQGLVNFQFTSNSGCIATSTNMIIAPRTGLFADNDKICVGASTGISSGAVTGTWSVLGGSESIIQYVASPSPTVIGLALGFGFMEFVSSNGSRDTLAITVTSKPILNLLGQDSLCIGSTTSFSSSTGGIWSSNNNSVATINQSTGAVTAVNGGAASFTFTTFEGCISTPTLPITVIPNAKITFTDPSLCIGETSSVISDLPGGTWISSNPSVATVDNSGSVVGISQGFTTIRYREPLLGCVTQGTSNIVVNSKPTVNASDNNICMTETAIALASPSAGSWSSNNNNIATVSNTGLVTPGSIAGIVTLTFTAQATGCQNSLTITVLPKPTISAISSPQICIGGTASIVGTPAGGSWSAEPQNGVASISANGIITGLAQGTTRFRYTQAGCQSELSNPIIVDGNAPLTINPYSKPEICIGESITLTATGSGGWKSLDPTIATIDSITGVVKAIAEGSVFFSISGSGVGCSSNTTAVTPTQLQVRQVGTATINLSSICVGASAFATPTTGGAWSSSDTSVAIILNNGTIVGKKVGSVSFVWQSISTGCKTPPSAPLSVISGPILNPPFDNILCLGESTNITAVGNPTGIWTSENSTIASINSSNGTITALQPGSTRFQFIASNGCQSDLSSSIFVRPQPVITINGSAEICINTTTNLNANTNGTWRSFNPFIATINPSTGSVTGIAVGIARFLFTSDDGCSSDSSFQIKVGGAPATAINVQNICVGGSAQATPSTGGVWNSSDQSVATISNNGVITTKKAGSVTFTFQSGEASCVSSSTVNLTVNGNPVVKSPGSNKIKVGEIIKLTSDDQNLVYESLNPDIAKVNSTTGIVEGLKVGTARIIAKNLSGCKSDEIVINVIIPRNLLAGFCFSDFNKNNIYDKGKDFPLPNVAIKIQGKDTTYFSNLDGSYSIPVSLGSQIVTYSIGFGKWEQSLIAKSLNIVSPITYNFAGFKPVPNAPSSAIASATTSGMRCKSTENLFAQAFNSGSNLLDGYLQITFDTSTYLEESDPAPAGSNNNTLIWTFEKLPPGNTFAPNIKFFVPDGLKTDSLYFEITVIDANTNAFLSTFQFGDTIECDPPKRLAKNFPDRIGPANYTLTNENISYQIKFENKGSGLANDITIISTIDPNLDISTLKIQGSSHQFDISTFNNKIVFYADSIDLGPKRSVEDGYITFTLNQRPNLADKTVIKFQCEYSLDNRFMNSSPILINTIVNQLPCDLINEKIIRDANKLTVAINAESYKWFDCNTNVQVASGKVFTPAKNGKYYCEVKGQNCGSKTECYDFIITKSEDFDLQAHKIVPNPSSSLIRIEPYDPKYKIEILDVMGRVVIKGYEEYIDVSSLTNGIYNVRIQEGERSTSLRLVKM